MGNERYLKKKMKKEKSFFNNIESKILLVMYKHQIPYTIYEIAKESGITYPTAKNYVKKFLKYKLLLKVNGNKYVYNEEIDDEIKSTTR